MPASSCERECCSEGDFAAGLVCTAGGKVLEVDAGGKVKVVAASGGKLGKSLLAGDKVLVVDAGGGKLGE